MAEEKDISVGVTVKITIKGQEFELTQGEAASLQLMLNAALGNTTGTPPSLPNNPFEPLERWYCTDKVTCDAN